MRAPLCSDSVELRPEDQGIGSESENNCEIQAIERTLEKCHSNKTAIFGICLDNLMGTTPQVAPQIPFVLTRLCRYIEEHGLQYKHLFLEGEERNVVESLKIEFIESGDAPLEAAGNVASVAKLLIIFFEELPEPLIPVSSQSDFIRDMEKLSLNTMDCVSHLKQSVNKLPDSAYHVLKYLSRLLFHVASHKEHNGMNPDKLSIIFGPVIFRLPADDSVNLTNARNVVNHFVRNYQAIFEDDVCSTCDDNVNQKPYPIISDVNYRRQVVCPSTVMPTVMTLMPLSVVIPSEDADMSNDNKSKENVPVLLIEGRKEGLSKSEGKQCTMDGVAKENVTRKRKERRLSGEDCQPRSSSEERPSPTSLISLDKMDMMRRCSSHEEMKEGTTPSDIKLEMLMHKEIPKRDSHSLDSFASDSLDLVGNEKNHSPHPPNAKRREVESNSVSQTNYNFMAPPWINSNQFNVSEKLVAVKDDICNFDAEQNSIVEMEATNPMECDTSESLEADTECDSINNNSGEFMDTHRARLRRSSSCPVPKADNNNNSDEESNSLSLSWSMLFESEDSEPVRSEHRYSWPLTKESQDDAALPSPSVQSLRSSYYEAPLSPSAYRSYLSYRSTHLDPSVPPSPPVEQEDFAKNLGESSATSDSIKQLNKKIHNIKKRIRKFDEKFEAEYGYKPSHAEKAINHDAKKLMNDLHKARKELKALKEESHLEQVSPASWHPSKSAHVLGDTTNQVKDLIAKPSIEDTYGVAMKSLADDRKSLNRPESVEAMTTQQVKDEKFAIQRALLEFESIHGKPSSKEERNTIRPLYDRYRCVKRLLVRSGSFPGALSKNKDMCTELQPILEHETMDFTSPQHRTENDTIVQNEDSGLSDLSSESKISTVSLEDPKTSSVLAVKYDNSNIHELPLSEMVFQLQQVKSQKRHLRKILREFEAEFLRLNGRKVQKEDKAPVDALYGEYKHVKARLKLLEALISKHDQHQLM